MQRILFLYDIFVKIITQILFFKVYLSKQSQCFNKILNIMYLCTLYLVFLKNQYIFIHFGIDNAIYDIKVK